MENEDKIYQVTNRSDGRVVYSIPEKGIRREFAQGESKKIKYSELEALSYQPGGRVLMQEYLQITDSEATQDLGIVTEPEYYMSESQIIDLIKTGSLDSFLDCLDFAPTGVLNLLKKLSVEIPLEDIKKRQVLKEKTGFDVDAAIKHQIESQEPIENFIQPNTERRVKVEQPEAPQGRRTTPSYKVINKTE